MVSGWLMAFPAWFRGVPSGKYPIPHVVHEKSSWQWRAWCVWVGSNGLGMIDAVARHVHGCAIRQIANIIAKLQVCIGILLCGIREAHGMAQWGACRDRGSHKCGRHRHRRSRNAAHVSRLGGFGRSLIWHGRVVETNTHFPVEAPLVSECVLHLVDATIHVAEEVVAHGKGQIAVQIDLVVVEHHV